MGNSIKRETHKEGKKRKLNWINKFDVWMLCHDINLLDKTGNIIGIARNVDEPIEPNQYIVNILERFRFLSFTSNTSNEIRIMDNKHYTEIYDLIWLSFNDKGIHDEELGDMSCKEVLKRFFDDLYSSNNPQFSIYHIQLAARLLGADSMEVVSHPRQFLLSDKNGYKLRLGEKIKV